MRRHYTNYLKGFPYIKEFRNQLVQKSSVAEIEEILSQVQQRYAGLVPERTLTSFTAGQLEDCAY
jgi:hypothetical protein